MLEKIKFVDNEKFLKTLENVFFIIDKKLIKFYPYLNLLSPKILVRGGENLKTLKSLKRVLKRLLTQKVKKDIDLVAIGGGSVLDFTSFLASIYKRGTGLIFVPTTLLGMADASIGGKNALNFFKTKNVIGTFKEPKSINMDLNYLKTLRKEDVSSGLSEIVKMLFIGEKYLNQIINYDFSFESLLKQALIVKEEIIKRDLFDAKERHILNFGHTLGHVFEVKYHLTHGLAVASGMLYESGSSKIKALLDKYDIFYNLNYKFSKKDLLNDKKLTEDMLKYYKYCVEKDNFFYTERNIDDAISEFRSNRIRLKSR